MDDRQRLRELLVRRSVRIGDFTLAGGARSSYYVDARRTTMTAEGQYLIGKVCRRAISESGWRPTHVGGLTMGADPVAYAVRKEPKGHGTGEQVEGGVPEGARAVVVEDATTTGASALKAIEALERHGVTVVGVLTLIDRKEGAERRIGDAGHSLISIFSGVELRDAVELSGRGPDGPEGDS
jgi:orotate phosphoribosyltransferase